MTATDFVRMSLKLSADEALALIEQMQDVPLTFPTANGGNHPLWILGHQAFSESRIIEEIMLGGESPMASWRPLFGPGSVAVADAAVYPAYEEVLRLFQGVRARTLAVLDTLSDADLDQPSRNCPPALQAILGTYAQCFRYVAYHFAYHAGQVADAHRMAGR